MTSFDDFVEKLSEKYHKKYNNTYDLLTYMEVKLVMTTPKKYSYGLQYEKLSKDAYKIIDRFYNISRIRDEKEKEGAGMKYVQKIHI